MAHGSSKSLQFYAVGPDLVSVCLELEAQHRVHYCKGGTTGEEIAEWFTAAAIPSFGVPTATSTAASQRYLIAPASEPFRPRSIHLRGGGIRWTIDQMINQASIVLVPGGALPNSKVVLAGQCGTATDSREGAVWKFIEQRLKRWEKVQGYRISPGAKKFFSQGYRLTSDIRDSAEYDLREAGGR